MPCLYLIIDEHGIPLLSDLQAFTSFYTPGFVQILTFTAEIFAGKTY